jgi:hypothetical protein
VWACGKVAVGRRLADPDNGESIDDVSRLNS